MEAVKNGIAEKDQKLALKEIPCDLNESLLRDAKAGLLIFGTLSVCYLMRKLKCSEDIAKKIMRKLETT